MAKNSIWSKNIEKARVPKNGPNSICSKTGHLLKYATRCCDDLFLAQIVTLFSRFVREQLFYTRYSSLCHIE